eukprot:383562-Hanusia_phi.AAC.2
MCRVGGVPTDPAVLRGGTWNFGIGTFPPQNGGLTGADYFDASVTDQTVPTRTHILGQSKKQILITCTSKSPSCACTGQTWPKESLVALGVQTNYGSYCAVMGTICAVAKTSFPDAFAQAWEDGDCASHTCGEKKTCVQMWPEVCGLCHRCVNCADSLRLGPGAVRLGATSIPTPASCKIWLLRSLASSQTCKDATTLYSSNTCPWKVKASFSIDEASYTMILDESYCNIVDKVLFENQILIDLSKALGVDMSFFEILSYSPGSIVVELKVVNGRKLIELGKSAGGLVAELKRQTLDPSSLLRQGTHTQYATAKTNGECMIEDGTGCNFCCSFMDNLIQSTCTPTGTKLDSLKESIRRRMGGCRNESCWTVASSSLRIRTSGSTLALIALVTLWALGSRTT